MKVQEVILRATAKKITWWQAAEIIDISDRQMPAGSNAPARGLRRALRSAARQGGSTAAVG
jgi:hypothetical protein